MEKLTNEEKAKIMALPLIELEGDDIKDTDSVMKGIKDVFATMELPRIDELVNGSEYHLVYSREDGDLVYMVQATYRSDYPVIVLTIEYSEVLKGKRRKKIAELINLLNIGFPMSCITMIPNAGVAIKSVLLLSRWFNTQELFWNLKSLLFAASCYLVMNAAVTQSNETPEAIVKRFSNNLQELKDAESRPSE